MGLSQILFYFIAVSSLIFAVLSVTTLRVMRSAVYLLFTLIATAAFYFIVNMDFLAVTQIGVYVGGIVVLILFAIVLTHEMDHKLDKPKPLQIISSLGLTAVGFVVSLYLLLSYNFTSSPIANQANFVKNTSTVENIGAKMLDLGGDGYILPFEVISVLLLAAMIGAIVIAIKEKA